MPRKRNFVWIAATIMAASPAAAGDWPMWRHDPGRTATAQSDLPRNLSLAWSRKLPPLEPAYRDNRLQFDGGYEPVVLGERLFVASSRDDSITAFGTGKGGQLWKFFANGPIRFAPVAGKGRVIFGSDDGCLYCLKASDGSLVWKKRAVPSNRRLLGNGRLISVWPIRGGPVLKDDRVYFAAGVWPLEGTFVFCVDAATGETIWRNDRASYLYGIHPHSAESYGGLAPQGYLVIDGDDLVVPCSQAYPARFDRETGELKDFKLPAPGRLPGGWFASTPSAREEQKLKRRGLLFDKTVNSRRHEDRMRDNGTEGIRDRIATGDREWKFSDGLPGIEKPVHSMAAAGGKLFATTTQGDLLCFAENPGVIHRYDIAKSRPPKFEPGVFAELGVKHGFGVLLGVGDEFLAMESPLAKAGLRIIGIDNRPDRVRSLREEGWINAAYGDRITILEDDPETVDLPPYFAGVIAIDQTLEIREISPGRLRVLYESLRPFGGKLVVVDTVKVPPEVNLPGARRTEHPAGWTIITREGPLPGSTNYTGDWAESPDDRVRGPLGVLWFDDALSHFKRSPQPKFIDGVMISYDKNWFDASTRKDGLDYRLRGPVFSDVYTGRILATDEAPELRQSFGDADLEKVQPSQYRPPRQKNDWKPDAPKAGERINPLTLEKEPRTFPKSYGCDGGVDYGFLYSMRSGTPAFYDKRIESGTVNISGPRSGCTNSVIPANGLLNLPYFYEGCTCSYPLPMALALTGMPESFEQWASWGEMPAEKLAGKIQRIGLNFGAPGDRVTEAGTLWLDVPNVGGPSPEIALTTDPPLDQLKPVYEHSLFLKPGIGWPWVAGSGFRGLRQVKIEGLKPGRYDVRIYYRETDEPAGFSIAFNNEKPRVSIIPPDGVENPLRSKFHHEAEIAVAESGTLQVDLGPIKGEPIFSGIELLRSGLDSDALPKW